MINQWWLAEMWSQGSSRTPLKFLRLIMTYPGLAGPTRALALSCFLAGIAWNWVTRAGRLRLVAGFTPPIDPGSPIEPGSDVCFSFWCFERLQLKRVEAGCNSTRHPRAKAYARVYNLIVWIWALSLWALILWAGVFAAAVSLCAWSQRACGNPAALAQIGIAIALGAYTLAAAYLIRRGLTIRFALRPA